MQKECEICGTFFEAIKPTRKYCDTCQKDSLKARRQLERAVIASKKYMGEYNKPKMQECGYCKKKFMHPRKQDFCSIICRDEYRIKTNRCLHCGELLYPKIKTTGNTCHDECKEAWYRKKAIENGRVKNCIHCNKEFYAKSKEQKYCSRECYKEYSDIERQKPVTYICEVCKQPFIIPRNHHFDRNPAEVLCNSSICHEKYNKWLERVKAKRQEKRTETRQEPEQATKDEHSKDVEENGLCAYCKTSYKDCERMTSNFRIIPNGAQYKNSKIVECPKYK